MEINKDKPRNQCSRKAKIKFIQAKKEIVYLIRKEEKVNKYSHMKSEVLSSKEPKNRREQLKEP